MENTNLQPCLYGLMNLIRPNLQTHPQTANPSPVPKRKRKKIPHPTRQPTPIVSSSAALTAAESDFDSAAFTPLFKRSKRTRTKVPSSPSQLLPQALSPQYFPLGLLILPTEPSVVYADVPSVEAANVELPTSVSDRGLDDIINLVDKPARKLTDRLQSLVTRVSDIKVNVTTLCSETTTLVAETQSSFSHHSSTLSTCLSSIFLPHKPLHQLLLHPLCISNHCST